MALYRKYRPRRFDDLVGQEAVVRLLRRALTADELGHALLLAGPRGCGKTTLARLVAKGLNCEASDGPTDEPCGQCDACTAIDADRSPDLWELDAASNRGVDDMRSLRERLATAPIGRAKVFILDEAHMLTREAQNALLKSLEEPPGRTYFLLCTTAPEKLLDTILSRCHRYPIRSASPAQLQVALRRVAGAEQREVDEAALVVVGEAANGSFRDGLSLLDQLLTGVDGPLDGALASELLGRPAVGLWAEVLAAAAGADAGGVLGHLARVWESSHQPQAELQALARYVRALLYLQATGQLPDSVPLPASVAEQASLTARQISSAGLLEIMEGVEHALGAAAAGLEWRLAVERALMDAAGARQRPAPAPPAPASAPAMQPAPVAAAQAPVVSDARERPAAAPDVSEPVEPVEPVEPDAAEPVPSGAAPASSSGELPQSAPAAARALAGALPALILSLRASEPTAYLALRLAGCAADDDTLVIRTAEQVPEPVRVTLAKLLTGLCRTAMPSVRWLHTPPAPVAAPAQSSSRRPGGPTPKVSDVDKLLGPLGFMPLNSQSA